MIVSIDYVRKRHRRSVDIGWPDISDVECMGMLVSHLGAAMKECPGNKPTPVFGGALACIVLHALACADRKQVSNFWLGDKGDNGINAMGREQVEGSKTTVTPLESLARITPEIAGVISACDADFSCAGAEVEFYEAQYLRHLRSRLVSVVKRTVILAERQGVDLEACLLARMTANEATGLMRSCAKDFLAEQPGGS